MRQNTKRIIAGVLAAMIVVAGGIGIASATGDAHDTPITGAALDRASAAALAYVGEGRVTDTEVGDEEGYYEIEVTRANGQQVDVHLDENFTVLGQEVDRDEGDD